MAAIELKFIPVGFIHPKTETGKKGSRWERDNPLNYSSRIEGNKFYLFFSITKLNNFSGKPLLWLQILDEKNNINNDVDIAVINETTGKTSIVELNENYNDFVTIQNKRLSRKMDRMWNRYLISKVKVQKSNLNAKDKSKFVNLARAKYLKQIKLSDKNNTDLENKLKKL